MRLYRLSHKCPDSLLYLYLHEIESRLPFFSKKYFLQHVSYFPLFSQSRSLIEFKSEFLGSQPFSTIYLTLCLNPTVCSSEEIHLISSSPTVKLSRTCTSCLCPQTMPCTLNRQARTTGSWGEKVTPPNPTTQMQHNTISLTKRPRKQCLNVSGGVRRIAAVEHSREVLLLRGLQMCSARSKEKTGQT